MLNQKLSYAAAAVGIHKFARAFALCAVGLHIETSRSAWRAWRACAQFERAVEGQSIHVLFRQFDSCASSLGIGNQESALMLAINKEIRS